MSGAQMSVEPQPVVLPSTPSMPSMSTPSSASSVPKRQKLLQETAVAKPPIKDPSKEKVKNFWGLFNNLVLKGKMKLEVLLDHEVSLPPKFTKEYLQNWVKQKLGEIEEDEHPEKYFDLDQYHVGIIVVDDDVKLREMMQALKGVDKIGIDTESDVMDKNQPVQLIQIAVDRSVYLFRQKDKDRLKLELRVEAGYVLSTKLFLFFASQNDRIHLDEFFPDIEISKMLDIQLLVKRLNVIVLDKIGNPKNEVSLSDCTHKWLGKPLNKAYTLSNWAKNGPLSQKQLVYAAADAFVLPLLYDAIKNDRDYSGIYESVIQEMPFMSGSPDNVHLLDI